MGSYVCDNGNYHTPVVDQLASLGQQLPSRGVEARAVSSGCMVHFCSDLPATRFMGLTRKSVQPDGSRENNWA